MKQYALRLGSKREFRTIGKLILSKHPLSIFFNRDACNPLIVCMNNQIHIYNKDAEDAFEVITRYEDKGVYNALFQPPTVDDLGNIPRYVAATHLTRELLVDKILEELEGLDITFIQCADPEKMTDPHIGDLV